VQGKLDERQDQQGEPDGDDQHHLGVSQGGRDGVGKLSGVMRHVGWVAPVHAKAPFLAADRRINAA
jgi:hypothetical protein